MTDTITLKKETLWKYSTFILAGLLIIGAIVFFTSDRGGSTANVVNNGATGQVATGDFSFAEDASLYPYDGPENADNVVIEFYDFQCPYCALASGLPSFAQQYASQYSDLFAVEGKLRDLADDGKIKMIYGTMSFLGAESGYAGEAGLCANEQGKFIPMYDAIFTAHDGNENNGKYTKDALKKIAAGISGLDQGEFASCLDSSKYASTVQTLNSNANGAGVSGTPTFVVNNKIIGGSWAQISAELKAGGVDI